jgi:flagellar basal body rod protein FlgF
MDALNVEKQLYDLGYTFIVLTETMEKNLFFTAVNSDGQAVEIRVDDDGWILDRNADGGYWDTIQKLKTEESA